jgi:hypothetical protein
MLLHYLPQRSVITNNASIPTVILPKTQEPAPKPRLARAS